MVTTKFFIARFAAAAALILGVTACTGGGGGSSSSSGPSSPSVSSSTASGSSASPTPSAVYKPADAQGPAENVPKPEKPALADEFSEQGLDAFTRYWYAAYNYAVETGDVEPVASITESSCSYCQSVMSNLDALYKANGWSVGGQIIVTRSQIVDLGLKPASNGAYQMMIQFNLPEARTFNSAGSVVESRPESVANGAIFNATFQDEKWSVFDIGRIG